MLVKVTECGWRGPCLNFSARSAKGFVRSRGRASGGQEREPSGRPMLLRELDCRRAGLWCVSCAPATEAGPGVAQGLLLPCVWETRVWPRPLGFGEKDLGKLP